MVSSSKYWQEDEHRPTEDTVRADDSPPPYTSLVDITNSARGQDDGRVLLTNLDRWQSVSKTVPADSYESLFDLQAITAKPLETSTVSSPVPRLAVVIHIVGSRGDVQPFIALSKELLSYGHRVRIATHEIFRKWVRGHNIEFFPLGGDPAELMAFMVENGGLIPGVASVARGDVGRKQKAIASILQSTWRSCVEPDDETDQPFQADLIISNPPSFGHLHCAEKLGLPLHTSFTMPWTPTGSFPHPLTNIDHSKSVRTGLNYMSYGATEYLTWTGLGDVINDFRKSLGLKSLAIQQGANALNELKVPYTYCWSPSLIPKPVDWGDHIDVTGFYFLDQASDYQPPSDLLAFLRKGPPPIYIGFGSVTGYDTKKLTSAVLEGVRSSGARAIISKGWAGLGNQSKDLSTEDPNIFFIGDCPHDWLFNNVAAVCHHGGAGTLSAGLRLGKPTIVVPFFGDQFFWGAMVYRMKAGPLPIPAREMTAEKLSAAIHDALTPDIVAKAQQIAKSMANENGVALGVASLHAHLPLNDLRSDLNHTHPARYRIPQFKKLKISHNVAQVLACAGLIEETQLEPYRTRQWNIPDVHDRVLATGALKATFQGLTGIFTDTAHGVKEAMKQGHQGNAAATVGKGFGKGVSKAVTFPFTAAALTFREISDGMNRCPRLWEPSYKPRPHAHISSFATGAKESGKALTLGLWDGCKDLVSKPYEYGKKEGAKGVAKGFGIGLLNFTWKPAAGALKMVECLGTGVYKEATKQRASAIVSPGILRTAELAETSDWKQAASELSGYEERFVKRLFLRFTNFIRKPNGKESGLRYRNETDVWR